ncbi:MAG: hypothetical protein P8P74_03785 [Crocinitomicaceae bacterium]|nr:hypothetical protein [Crocinitomicaceae bacterium]
MDFEEDDNVSYPSVERIVYAIGAITIVIGIILKYNRLRYAQYFLLIGVGISLVSYIVGFFAKKKKEDRNELDQF